jgi:hypothetical protein
MKFRFNLNPFARALLIGSLALSATACIHDDDDDGDAPAVVVPPANEAPVVSSVAVTSAEEGVVYTYTLTATDADAGDTLVLASVTLPTWLTFDIASGELSGTPAAADVGDNAVSLTVTDGTDTTTQDFTIAVTAAPVVNTAPTFTSTGLAMGTVGTVYSYTATATDADAGDTLMLSSVVLPTWGAFDSSTGILSGTPDMAGSYDAELMVSDGTDAVTQAFTIVVTDASAMTLELLVFENAALEGWVAWTDDGGPTELFTDDVEHDVTTRFTLTKPSVAGFSARPSENVNGVPFDASNIVSNGMLTFELKMLEAPTAGVVDWKLKIEGSASNVEVNLSTSSEGHATPVKDVWQTYTFPLAELDAAGELDFSDIALFMVFPNYGDATGADYLLDNFKIVTGDTSGGDTSAGDVTSTTIDAFEGEIASYEFNNFEGGVSTVVSNPDATGINTSAQVVKMEKFAGQTFGGSTLLTVTPFALPADSSFTLKVWSTRSVDVLFKLEGGTAGERTATHSGSGWEELSFDFAGVEGAGINGITFIFDNGTNGDAEGDAVNWTFYYDDIVLNASGGTIDTGPVVGTPDIGDTGLVANGGFELGTLDGWFGEGAGIAVELDDLGTYLVKIVAPEAQSPSVKQSRIGEGVITPGQALTVSFDMKGTAAGDGGVVNAILFTEAPSGVSKTDVLVTTVPTADWMTYSYNVTAGTDTEWGVAILLQPACGAVAGCEVTAYFDNVVITVD